MNDTRSRILDEALTLFSENGYGAVTVGQIADAVGIKAPSLYKHFAGKRDIFDAILRTMSERCAGQAASMGMDGSDPAADGRMFSSASADDLVRTGTGLFEYFLHDSRVSRFRRMLTMGQYSDPGLASLLSAQYVDGPLAYQSGMFSVLAGNGVLKGEPDLLALEFYSPMHMLLAVCDRQPDREGECLRLLERHIRDFAAVRGRCSE